VEKGKEGALLRCPRLSKEEVSEMDDKTLDEFPVAQKIEREGPGNGFEFAGNALGFAKIGFPMA
jgi:hypothetical protein